MPFSGDLDRHPHRDEVVVHLLRYVGHLDADVRTGVRIREVRADLGYPASLGALDDHGHPIHREGVSLTHHGVTYVGLEWQRSLSSNCLRGVGGDASRVVRRLAAHGHRG